MGKKFLAAGILFVATLALTAGILLFMAFPVTWCWNYAVVPTFHARAISWGEAWCLLFLALVFVKSTSSGATVSKS